MQKESQHEEKVEEEHQEENDQLEHQEEIYQLESIVQKESHHEEIFEEEHQEEKDKLEYQEGELPIVTIHKLEDKGEKNIDPVIVKVRINGHEVKMELDTGATYTCMGAELFQRIGGGELGPPECMLKTYTGEVIRPKGTAKVGVEYNSMGSGLQKLELKVTVVDMEVPTLLGREWLAYLKIDWHRLFPVQHAEKVTIHNIEELKKKCPEVFNEKGEEGKGVNITLEEVRKRLENVDKMFPNAFSGRLGRLKDVKVHIPVRENAEHKYHKARPVPHALRKRVEEELESLEEQGV